jgi:hypothetical protein
MVTAIVLDATKICLSLKENSKKKLKNKDIYNAAFNSNTTVISNCFRNARMFTPV